MALLKSNKLTKDYGNHKGAFDISIEINPGEIVGFIGPNGAGKTTTMLMLTGFIKPTSGSFQIFDTDVDHLSIYKLMDRIGILMSDVAYSKSDSAETIFRRHTELTPKITEDWKILANYFDLDIKKKFGSLSLGNKKKIGIISAIMHNPDLLILDEPTSGLDPLMQQKFLSKITDIKNRGGSILLSSHVLSEVQSACDRIIMIKNGDILMQDTTKNILTNIYDVYRLFNSEDNLELVKQAEGNNLVTKYEVKNGDILAYSNKKKELIKFFSENDFYDYYIERPNLEDMFMESYK